MHRRIFTVVAAVVALGALAPTGTAWGSKTSPNNTVGYVYQCSNSRILKVKVSGNAVITTFPRIRLTGVKFVVFNSFGPITVNSATFTVPDPNPASAPYVAASVAVAALPPGWTAAHTVATGIEAIFAGAQAVAAGGQFANAVMSAKYGDLGPPATVISFLPGPISFNTTPGGTINCQLTGNPAPFAQVTE
jgi:hypothetical protein